MKKIEIKAKEMKIEKIISMHDMGLDLQVPVIEDNPINVLLLATNEVPSISGSGVLIARVTFKEGSPAEATYGRKVVVVGKEFMKLSKQNKEILIRSEFLKLTGINDIIDGKFINANYANPSMSSDKEMAIRLTMAKEYGFAKEKVAHQKKEKFATKTLKDTSKKIKTISDLVKGATIRSAEPGIKGFIMSGFMTKNYAAKVVEEYAEYFPEETLVAMMNGDVTPEQLAEEFSAIDMSKIAAAAAQQ